MERKISFKNLYLVGVISLGLIGLGVGSTFAMFTASAEINDSISLTSGLNYQDDVVDLVDMSISSNDVETATLNITNNTTKTLNYTSWYKTDNNNLQIGTVVSNNNSVTGTIAPNGTVQIIVSIRNRGTGVAKVTVGISASEDSIVISDGVTTLPSDPLPPYLNDYITSLYTGATKSNVTNNSITYHYATSVNLMNDRLGSADTGIDEGNIRYHGASPNNYIDIGDRTSNDEVILYRIIGIFDDKVKVIRDESIGNFSYDSSSSTINDGHGINEWSQADIMKLLNPGYDNETIGGSLWWNRENGNCYNGTGNISLSCNFSLSIASEQFKKLISTNNWFLGGSSNNAVYPDQSYTSERDTNLITNPADNVVRTGTWTGKIGLFYPSDYGYAADLDNCTETLVNYNNCINYNWLDSGNYEWVITPATNYETHVWRIKDNGSVSAGSYAADSYYIRPTFYLIEKAVLESGTGTSTDPFVVD